VVTATGATVTITAAPSLCRFGPNEAAIFAKPIVFPPVIPTAAVAANAARAGSLAFTATVKPEYTTPPLKAGTHEYICSLGGGFHCIQKGMYQKVVVTPL
jgi:hypothetical protein